MWSAMHTRFDIAYSVKILSRYAHNLSSTHCILIKKMLKYVAETINVDLTFNQSDDLIDYSDSDFVELKDKRHSTEDYVFMLVEKTISHSFKQQFIIALSSCKIKYMTLSKTAKEAIWIRQFLHELKFRNDDQFVLIFADNKDVIDLIINSSYQKKNKAHRDALTLNQKNNESKENHLKILTHQRNDNRRFDQVVVCFRIQQISNHAESQQLINRERLIKFQ
jgi:hypothetical protein